MQASYPVLLDYVDRLMQLHQKNDCVWADFFAGVKDRMERDPAFGRDYLITAYGGMFNYEDFGILPNAGDERKRLETAEIAYQLAKELKQ